MSARNVTERDIELETWHVAVKVAPSVAMHTEPITGTVAGVVAQHIGDQQPTPRQGGTAWRTIDSVNRHSMAHG